MSDSFRYSETVPSSSFVAAGGRGGTALLSWMETLPMTFPGGGKPAARKQNWSGRRGWIWTSGLREHTRRSTGLSYTRDKNSYDLQKTISEYLNLCPAHIFKCAGLHILLFKTPHPVKIVSDSNFFKLRRCTVFLINRASWAKWKRVSIFISEQALVAYWSNIAARPCLDT